MNAEVRKNGGDQRLSSREIQEMLVKRHKISLTQEEQLRRNQKRSIVYHVTTVNNNILGI